MNYLSAFDDSMVVGHLKAANSTDLDVLHSRQKSLVSSLELWRKLAIVPMVPAGIWVLVGIPALLLIVGIVPLTMGSATIYGCVWCRKRMAANIAVAESAYAKYIATLNPGAPPLALSARHTVKASAGD